MMEEKTFKIKSGKYKGQEFPIDDLIWEGELDFIAEESVNEIMSFFDEVDRARLHILEGLKLAIEIGGKGYGPAKQLQALYDIKKQLSNWILMFEADIPDLANIEFLHSKKLNEDTYLTMPDDYKISDRTLRKREKQVEWHNNQLQRYLTYQLKSLKPDVDNGIAQIKNFQDNPNIEDWYPELADKDDPRIKYHSYNYWNTAIDLYHSDTYGSREAVYNHIDKEMKRLGLEHRKKLSTFKTRLSKEIVKKRNNHE